MAEVLEIYAKARHHRQGSRRHAGQNCACQKCDVAMCGPPRECATCSTLFIAANGVLCSSKAENRQKREGGILAALPRPETTALAASPSYVARDFMSHASELLPDSQAARVRRFSWCPGDCPHLVHGREMSPPYYCDGLLLP